MPLCEIFDFGEFDRCDAKVTAQAQRNDLYTRFQSVLFIYFSLSSQNSCPYLCKLLLDEKQEKKTLYIRDSLTSVNLPILLTISYRTHCPRQSRSAFVLLVLFGDLFKYSPALFRANINNFIARPGNQCQSLKVTRRREQSVPWLRHGGVSTTGEYTFGRVRSFPVKRILVKPCFL